MNAHKETEISGYINLVRYVPSKPGEFDMIRDMVKSLGLAKEQMLR